VKWKYIFSGKEDSGNAIPAFAKGIKPLSYLSNNELPLQDQYQEIKWDNKNLPNPDGKVIKAAPDGSNPIAEIFV